MVPIYYLHHFVFIIRACGFRFVWLFVDTSINYDGEQTKIPFPCSSSILLPEFSIMWFDLSHSFLAFRPCHTNSKAPVETIGIIQCFQCTLNVFYLLVLSTCTKEHSEGCCNDVGGGDDDGSSSSSGNKENQLVYGQST